MRLSASSAISYASQVEGDAVCAGDVPGPGPELEGRGRVHEAAYGPGGRDAVDVNALRVMKCMICASSLRTVVGDQGQLRAEAGTGAPLSRTGLRNVSLTVALSLPAALGRAHLSQLALYTRSSAYLMGGWNEI